MMFIVKVWRNLRLIEVCKKRKKYLSMITGKISYFEL